MGMDEATRDRIFAPFFTKKTRGIGLGLAVTKRIMKAHGGTIAVQSTPSAGSSFTLTLPVQHPRWSACPSERARRTKRARGAGG